MEKPHQQLLLSRYNSCERKSEIRSGCMRWKSPICSCCSHDLLSDLYTRSVKVREADLHLLLPRYSFFKQKSENRSSHDTSAAPTLRFSGEKKPKQVMIYEIEKAHVQLLLRHYGFYKQRRQKAKTGQQGRAEVAAPTIRFFERKSQNRSECMRWTRPNCSCHLHHTSAAF